MMMDLATVANANEEEKKDQSSAAVLLSHVR